MLVYQDWLEMAQFDYSEAWIKLNTLWEMCHIESGKHFARDFNPGKLVVHKSFRFSDTLLFLFI